MHVLIDRGKGMRAKSDEPEDQNLSSKPSVSAVNEFESSDASRAGVYMFYVIMYVLGVVVVTALTYKQFSVGTVALALVVGFLLASAVRVALQWESVVILRFGKFHRLAGPGLYFCVPLIEYPAIEVDQRMKTASFSAEAALTADLVPVNVDAILFWMVWDTKRACLEVENYPKAVLRSAQTAMRDVIVRMNLVDISMRRKQIDRELEEALSEKCEGWGITVASVEIRDITIPRGLQDALSREAQAERERNARVILAEAERDISEMFVEAAEEYDKNPRAMKLRAMNLAYESAKDSRGVLLAPSALADAFNVEGAALPRS